MSSVLSAVETAIVEEFLEYLSEERHFSPHTRKCYRGDLEDFGAFLLRSNPQIESLDALQDAILGASAEQVLNFLVGMERENYGASTVARKRATLGSFYKFCTKRQYIEVNPAKKVKAPRVATRAPRYLNDEEVGRLLDEPNSERVLGARDRAILELIYATGVGVGNLVRLKVGNIMFAEHALVFKPRGHTVITAPLGNCILATLLNYLRFRGITLPVDAERQEERLFVNRHGKPLSQRSVRRKLDKYLLAIGLNDDEISPHTLRHTFAAHALREGIALTVLRERLGHQSLATTQALAARLTGKITADASEAMLQKERVARTPSKRRGLSDLFASMSGDT